MQTIDNQELYNKHKEFINQNFNIESHFPEQVFKSVTDFLFLDFDAFHSRKFYNAILKATNDKYLFYTIDPNPEEYMSDYKKYSVIEFLYSDKYESFIQNLHESRNSGYVDSIIDLVNELVFCSFDLSFSAYANRDFNILVVGFEELNVKNTFLEQFGIENIYKLDEVIKDLKINNYPDENFIAKLNLNYNPPQPPYGD